MNISFVTFSIERVTVLYSDVLDNLTALFYATPTPAVVYGKTCSTPEHRPRVVCLDVSAEACPSGESSHVFLIWIFHACILCFVVGAFLWPSLNLEGNFSNADVSVAAAGTLSFAFPCHSFVPSMLPLHQFQIMRFSNLRIVPESLFRAQLYQYSVALLDPQGNRHLERLC